MPHQRQRDPQTWARGGEIALVAIAAGGLAVALAALLGLGVAAAWFGGGWVWPHGGAVIGQVLGGLLTGHPGAALPAAASARVPDRDVVYSCVAACELLLIGSAIAVAQLATQWIRPSDARRGMATRREAQRVLGKRRLYESARLIRPDLHRKNAVLGGSR